MSIFAKTNNVMQDDVEMDDVVIVTDAGFGPDDWAGGEAAALASDEDPEALADRLGTLGLIRVTFPSFADGRGFTLARRLRGMGYTGRLRATGRRPSATAP